MAKVRRQALALPVQDLSKAVELAVQKAVGVPKIRPGIIVGRWVDGELPNANQLAAAITRQMGPQLKGLNLKAVAIPGKGGVTVGFIAPSLER
jgi:hypothetical protein